MYLSYFTDAFKEATILSKLIIKRFKWTSTIGLEIHAQMATKTKLFSGANTNFGLPINSSVNLNDIAVPGSLPVLNKRCVELAVLSSQALSCCLSQLSHFDRKHYFYADLPAGYQITQQRSPIAKNGVIEFYVYNPGIHKIPYKKRCKLKQLQIEQDSGKSLHDLEKRTSLLDINRAGVGLLEFVFEPELHDGEEAAALVKELVLILERLDVCSCKMEEGALRIDANVSVSNIPEKLGTRTEIKNIGSIRGVANAIKYEIDRQLDIVKSGGSVINETRGWDPHNKTTTAMRQKDHVHDYRFMPEPNLPPLRLCLDNGTPDVHTGTIHLGHIFKKFPEMPETSRSNLIHQHGFNDIYAISLVNQPRLLTVFKNIMSAAPNRNAKLVWKVLLVQLLNVLHDNGLDTDSIHLKADVLGDIVDLLQDSVINFEIGRDIMKLIFVNGSKSTPRELVDNHKWHLVSDMAIIEAVCIELIARNPKAVKKVKKGKQKALQSIVNDAVNISSEKLNLSLVARRLNEMISQNT